MTRLIIGRRGLARHLAEVEEAHQEELSRERVRGWTLEAQMARCRREHTDLANRNSALQTMNIRLAAQLEKAEMHVREDS